MGLGHSAPCGPRGNHFSIVRIFVVGMVSPIPHRFSSRRSISCGRKCTNQSEFGATERHGACDMRHAMCSPVHQGEMWLAQTSVPVFRLSARSARSSLSSRSSPMYLPLDLAMMFPFVAD